MPKITLNVTLTLQGPILTQSSTPGEYGLDAAMARRADGIPYLPGTLILGRLRQAWEELSEAAPGIFMDKHKIEDYLGDKSSTGNLPQRKRIQCSDFIAINSDKKGSLHRIRIDKERGTVDTGAYLVIDSPFAPGEEVKFIGSISYLIPVIPEGKSDELKDMIEKGLRWITSFGAQRTVGFGRLLKVAITADAPASPQSAKADPTLTYLRLLIKPHGSFCIAKRQIDKNLFESEEIIPGGTIKGGLASTWGMLVAGNNPNAEIGSGFDTSRAELAEAFEKIRFSHAFPVQAGGKRPVCAPLSLVKNREETKIDDVALWENADLFDGEAPKEAPKFAVDWKDESDVARRFGWPQLDRELRVRTAMNRSTRKSEDEKLFAYEMIVPNGHEWEAQIDLSRVDAGKREKVIQQLIDLLGFGLNSWGKTKTGADTWITGAAGFPDIKSRSQDGKNYYIITLQTPAILCDPTKELDETSGQKELLTSYRKDWDELSDNSLHLERFFARQSLAGGEYLHKRFQPEKAYYPWLLTDAGSAFVFSVTNETTAIQKVDGWLKNGLPLPNWAKGLYQRTLEGKVLPGNHWKCCPYIPENGYGEIALNINLKNFPEVRKEGNDE